MSDRENYTGYDCADCGLPLLTLAELMEPCKNCGSIVCVISSPEED